MFIECSTVRKCLSTESAFDLRAAICVHSFVTAKIGKLSVGFKANFTLKWFDRGVNMHMLFETAGCRKRFSTFSARMVMIGDGVGILIGVL